MKGTGEQPHPLEAFHRRLPLKHPLLIQGWIGTDRNTAAQDARRGFQPSDQSVLLEVQEQVPHVPKPWILPDAHDFVAPIILS